MYAEAYGPVLSDTRRIADSRDVGAEYPNEKEGHNEVHHDGAHWATLIS